MLNVDILNDVRTGAGWIQLCIFYNFYNDLWCYGFCLNIVLFICTIFLEFFSKSIRFCALQPHPVREQSIQIENIGTIFFDCTS